MKKFFRLALILITPSAFAGSINLDFRTDYLSQDYNDAAVTAGAGHDSTRFYMNTGRIDFKGALNESVGYRVRWRFAAKNQGNVDQRDNTNGTLDLAFLEHKISDSFKLQFGKYLSEIGGYEGLISGPDLYLTSEAYSGTAALGGSSHHVYAGGPTATGVNLTGHSTELYITGVKAVYTMGSHEINLQAAGTNAGVGRNYTASAANVASNSRASDVLATDGKIAQTKNLMGVVYKGNFMDKSIGMIASYHTQSPGSSDTKSEYTAVGFQYKAEALLAQLEYVMNTYKGVVGTTTLTNPTDKLNSAIATLKYFSGDHWTYIAKYTSSEETFDTSTGSVVLPSVKNKYSSYGVVAEWKPVKDDIFRYHLAYNAKNMKPETGDERKLQEIMAGVRINADFLK